MLLVPELNVQMERAPRAGGCPTPSRLRSKHSPQATDEHDSKGHADKRAAHRSCTRVPSHTSVHVCVHMYAPLPANVHITIQCPSYARLPFLPTCYLTLPIKCGSHCYDSQFPACFAEHKGWVHLHSASGATSPEKSLGYKYPREYKALTPEARACFLKHHSHGGGEHGPWLPRP